MLGDSVRSGKAGKTFTFQGILYMMYYVNMNINTLKYICFLNFRYDIDDLDVHFYPIYDMMT